MDRGDLLSLLHREEVTTEELEHFCIQIASGMAYVHAKDIVHRDLAARNVLISEKRQVKLADFGLGRVMVEDIYKSKSKNVPIRWTAPEALLKKNFTKSSDVWSFGVTMFEIFSKGEQPYSNMDNRTVFEEVTRNNHSLSAPSSAPNYIAETMANCFKSNPSKRPNFSDIYARLSANGQHLDPSSTNINDDYPSHPFGSLHSGGSQEKCTVSTPETQAFDPSEGGTSNSREPKHAYSNVSLEDSQRNTYQKTPSHMTSSPSHMSSSPSLLIPKNLEKSADTSQDSESTQ